MPSLSMFKLGKHAKDKSTDAYSPPNGKHSRQSSLAQASDNANPAATIGLPSPTSPNTPKVPPNTAVAITSPTSSHSASSTLPPSSTLNARPFDVLHERFFGWKVTTKQLVIYFEGIVESEQAQAKKMHKIGEGIEVPNAARGHFAEGGVHDVVRAMREKTRSIGDDHAALAKSVESHVIEQIKKLRGDIKAHMRTMENDTGKLSIAVDKERENSNRLITDLSNHLNTIKHSPSTSTNVTDPYLTNIFVTHQLGHQITTENNLHESLISLQAHSKEFDASIMSSLHQIFQSYNEHHTRAYQSIQTTQDSILQLVTSIAPSSEWDRMIQKNPHALLDPNTPKRDPLHITYPNQQDSHLTAVQTGIFERKKRYTGGYRTSFFTLTPSGFLHEWEKEKDHDEGQPPIFTLFLPECTLGPQSGPATGTFKFFIEGHRGTIPKPSGGVRRPKGTVSGLKRSMSGVRGKGSKHAWSFKFRSKDDMARWHGALLKFVAGEEGDVGRDREGPVKKAVREAGYTSGEEGEEGESSDYESAEEDGSTAPPPSYGHGRGASLDVGIAGVGAHGYTDEKTIHESPTSATSALNKVQPSSIIAAQQHVSPTTASEGASGVDRTGSMSYASTTQGGVGGAGEHVKFAKDGE